MRGVVRNEENMIVPASMRNFRERQILFGLIHLRRCERVDLFWGRIKDIEIDFLYAHGFIVSMTLIIIGYILVTTTD